jgi:acetaldehyde dehydrogenase
VGGLGKVAVIGSGNIGTGLKIKVVRLSERLEVAAMGWPCCAVGIHDRD